MKLGSFRAGATIIPLVFLLAMPFAGLGQAAGKGAALPGSPAYLPTPDHPVGWRGDGTGRYPATDPPTVWSRRKTATGYEDKNILWTARMPGPSVATPIIVGDRIFATAEVNDLICLDRKSGRILWIRSNSEFEGLGEDERKPLRGLSEASLPLVTQMAATNDALVAALNSGNSSDIEPLIARKKALGRQLYDLLIIADRRKYRRDWNQGVFGFSGPTPTSDGRHVCVFFTTGIVACYDLDGNRKWIDLGRGDGSEHGNFASPLLVADRLVVWAGEMRGYDVETGKIVFTNPVRKGNSYGSLFRMRSGNEWVAGFQSGYFTRISDGKPIWGEQIFGDAIATPIVEEGKIFAWVGIPRNSEHLGFKAYPIPTTTSETPLKPAYAFNIDWTSDELPEDKGLHQFERTYTASPLFVDGLIYQLTQGGGLTVNDAATGELVYRKVLKLHPFAEDWDFAGASASPTLAGGFIYLMDNQGATIIMKPGRSYVEVAQNVIETESDGKHQQQNLATPIFEGTRLYYRMERELLCIGEK